MVEGTDDQFVIIALISRATGLDWNRDAARLPYIHPPRGIQPLLDVSTVSAALKSYEQFGLVLDADTDPGRRWRELRTALSPQISLPDALPEGGMVTQGIKSTSSRFGVWLMPDNRNPGELMEFLRTMIPDADPLLAHASQATREAVHHGAGYAPGAENKATMRAWLAWQEQPGLPPGRAIESGYLKGSSPAADAFVAWFKAVFL